MSAPAASARRPAHGLLVLTAALLAACAPKGVPLEFSTWIEPFPPFRVAGNVHFVGTRNLGIFLVTTPAGHVLFDSGFEANVPALRASIEKLGFRFADVKLLLASHAHIDHVQGHAEVRRLTGARVLASERDAPVIASGGRGEWAYGDRYAWPPCPVDGVVRDGERVSLGGTTLVAHLTPGHTRGATTWTTTVVEDGRPLEVVFFASGNVPIGTPRLAGNPAYPEAVADFERSFAAWKAMPCDVFLGAHGDFFDLRGKHRRLVRGERPSPFIDPDGFKRVVAEQEAKFRAVLESQR
jgi:metallo-beta-lactamase class B